jgi:2-dehydro-3-deoxygluconokinase
VNGRDHALDLATIGESMLRLMAPAGQSLEAASHLDIAVAGAESNVAVALSRLGHATGWVSSLPDNALGRLVANRIREHGVDTSRVRWEDGSARLGIYYWEDAAPPRPGRVIYDRADSAFARTKPDELDWDYVGAARRLHLTGITPALSSSCLETVTRALRVARARRRSVSFDVNYRATLWSAAEAAATLAELVHGVDVLFSSSRDAARLFGAKGAPEEQAAGLARRFDCPLVVVTCGADGAAAWDGRPHRIRALRAEEVDPIGRGDAFVAGFLHGVDLAGTAAALRYAAAAAALKQTFRGDLLWATAAEVDAALEPDRIAIER